MRSDHHVDAYFGALATWSVPREHGLTQSQRQKSREAGSSAQSHIAVRGRATIPAVLGQGAPQVLIRGLGPVSTPGPFLTLPGRGESGC